MKISFFTFLILYGCGASRLATFSLYPRFHFFSCHTDKVLFRKNEYTNLCSENRTNEKKGRIKEFLKTSDATENERMEKWKNFVNPIVNRGINIFRMLHRLFFSVGIVNIF